MNKRPKAPAATSTDVGALGKTGFPNVMTGFPPIYQSPQPASQHISFIHEHSGQPDLLCSKEGRREDKDQAEHTETKPRRCTTQLFGVPGDNKRKRILNKTAE